MLTAYQGLPFFPACHIQFSFPNMSFFRTLFFRKKKAPLVCTLDLHDDPTHVHGEACYVEIQPLSIVEFFVSQGCEASPPAMPLVQKSASANPNVLLLTYNVGYVSHLYFGDFSMLIIGASQWNAKSGWTDTFSNAAWDARQRAYVTRWKRSQLYTPQLVIDGIADGNGSREGDFSSILSLAIQARNDSVLVVGMEPATQDGRQVVKIASDTTEAEVHDVVILSYDGNPKGETVKVGKGPNKGKKLAHHNLVKEVLKIDEWAGKCAP